MADTREASIPTDPQPPVVGREEKEAAVGTRSRLWQRLSLGAIMLISLFMNFYQLGQNGFGNLYYAAGVRSMLDNLQNFFFVSFDPGGFVSVDKPPLGFWLQVLSAKIFGFTPFSVYFPQALAGVLAVVLLYHLVKRHFGVVAGLLAALALALSPISVVTNRNNTIDSTLALALLLGAWAVMKAAETGRLRWLLLSAVAVGLGFNIKMLEAYLVVPAFGLLYLLAAPRSLWKRIGHLTLAGVVLVALTMVWLLAVDLTPASQRPYVGSSQDNSEISLALGYNGINRLLGQFGFGGRANVNRGTNTTGNGGSGFPGTGGSGGTPPFGGGNGTPPFGGGGGGTPPVGGGGPAGGGPGGAFDTGTAGPLRLFTEPLGGQIAWLLPLALLALLALAWQKRWRFQRNREQQSMVLWGVWLLTMGIFFSVAGFFHQYYLTEMAPAIAALFGIGIVVMWRDFRNAGWRGWLLPIALAATALEQIYILNSYPEWGQTLIPLIAVLCLVGAVALVVMRSLPRMRETNRLRYPALMLGVALLGLMLTPTVWAAIPVLQDSSVQLPVAGPSKQAGFGGRGFGGQGIGDAGGTNAALISYLEAHQGNTKFLVAVPSSMTADQIILQTNKPVMALGGFSGSDPILTTDQLAALVKNGTVRYFLHGGFGGGGQIPPQILEEIPEQYRDFLRNGGGRFGGQQGALTSWVTQNCTVVPASQLQTGATDTGGTGLYDCASGS